MYHYVNNLVLNLTPMNKHLNDLDNILFHIINKSMEKTMHNINNEVN